MGTDKGFIAPGGGGSNRAHVERTALLAEIDAELARSGIVVLRAPWGYGRTMLMRDYARIAHARTPGRPIVRVDFDTYEAQSFLNGNREPFMRLVAHLLRGAEKGGERAAEGGERRPARRPKVPSLRKMPPQHTSDVTQVMYECIAACAPGWCARLEGGAPPDSVSFKDLPLVTIDNLPIMDEQALGVLGDAMTAWSQAGARLLLACSPSSLITKSLMPTAFVIGAQALSVSRGEIGLWSQGLRFAEGIDIVGATAGVPMLVDACRSVQDGDPRTDEAFLRTSDRVLERCLDELMYGAAERCRWAMAMLGRGTFADLTSVGVSMRDDELAILNETYPLLGIDMLKGTFDCIPMSCGRDSGAALRAVGGDEALSMRCVELLVRRGRLKRAGELAALLSGACRLRLFGRNPDAFADAANSGSIERSMKAVLVGEEVDAVLRPGLSRLAQLHAIAHDVPLRMLPDYVLQHSAGSSEGALHAVKSVLGFWRTYSGPGDARSEGDGKVPGWEKDVVVGREGDEGASPTGIDGIVHAMGEAALRGDAKAYLTRLDALRDAVALSEGGLAAAVYASHAALCAFLCDRAETALELVEPLAGAARDGDCPAGRAASVSQALLGASYAVARLLVERPSSVRIAAGALESVRASRRFFEERRIEPAVAYTLFLEALCMLSAGDERGAAMPLGRCRSRWGAQGTLLGQLAGGLALCVTDLAQDAVNQAAVHAQAAEALAQRLGIRRGVWLARLFGTVSAVRNGNAPDLDRRLLEGTLRRSALHPAVSIELELELALLYAARGDAVEARGIFQSVGVFGRPCACRLLVVAVRGLGRSRSCVLDLLPRRLRAEYEALRPSSTFKRYAGVSSSSEPPAVSGQGLLALPAPGKGLSIGLLGGLRANVNGHAVGIGAWGRRKSRIILQVLALYPETPVGRDTLMEILWEGSQPSPLLRNNLNTALSSLRSSLGQKGGGPQYIVTMGGAVGFDLDLVDVDVLRFERLARMTLARRNVGDPLELMDACSTLEQLFQTGFGPEFQALPRKVHQRIKEIEDLFVECMLLGASVALGEGDCQLSMWFARAAARVSPRREDVRGALAAAGDALARPPAAPTGARAARELRSGDPAGGGAALPEAAAMLPALVGEADGLA